MWFLNNCSPNYLDHRFQYSQLIFLQCKNQAKSMRTQMACVTPTHVQTLRNRPILKSYRIFSPGATACPALQMTLMFHHFQKRLSYSVMLHKIWNTHFLLTINNATSIFSLHWGCWGRFLDTRKIHLKLNTVSTVQSEVHHKSKLKS